MELKGQSVNRVYSIKEKTGEDFFYEWWEATSMYSAEIFNVQFCKYSLLTVGRENFDHLRESFLRTYDIQTPYLYKPFEMGSHENTFFLALPRIKSTALQTLIDSSVVFPFEIALKISINMLRGLSLLERKKLHHNLLTPHNVWLTEAGHDITNIKISGFLDFHILHGLKEQHSVYEKQNKRYFYTNPRTTAAMESKAENDIFSAGVILSEMLTGDIFNTFKDLEFPSGLPKWLKPLIEKMIKDPESFQSIQTLLDLFITRSPEHSILEDAIEERIEEHGKGFTGTGNDPIPLEELPAIDDNHGNVRSVKKGNKTVKRIVSIIKAFFKRKKQKSARLTEQVVDEQNKQTDENLKGFVHSEDDSINRTKGRQSDYQTTHRINLPGKTEADSISPWEVDKDRYMERKVADPDSVPVHHTSIPEVKGKINSGIHKRNYSSSENKIRIQSGFYQKSGDRSNLENKKGNMANKNIELLKKHREKSDGEIFPKKPQGPSVNVSKMKYSSVSDNDIPNGDIQREADHGTIKRVNKRRISNKSIILEKQQEDTRYGALPVSGISPGKATLFQRFLIWVKALFTGK